MVFTYISYLPSPAAVYANATSKRDKQGYREKAMEVFKTEFTKLGIKPSTYTYRGLIRMHILAKDIDAALKLKDDMIKDHNVVPDAESYGWLIRSCGHRDLLVEGLQLLEEVTERGSVFFLIQSFNRLSHTAGHRAPSF